MAHPAQGQAVAISGVDSSSLTFLGLCCSQAAHVVPGRIPNSLHSPCPCTHGSSVTPCPSGKQRGDVGLHGLLLVQHSSVVVQVPAASISAGWWQTTTQKNTGCKLSSEGAVHSTWSWLGTTVLHHESIRGAALCSPHLTLQSLFFFLSCCQSSIPLFLMGSHGLGGQGWQELSSSSG